MMLSKNDWWFGATMTGPSGGKFSSPSTVGRQVPEITERNAARVPSKNSIPLPLRSLCGGRLLQCQFLR
jgi:hypothetical protein